VADLATDEVAAGEKGGGLVLEHHGCSGGRGLGSGCRGSAVPAFEGSGGPGVSFRGSGFMRSGFIGSGVLRFALGENSASVRGALWRTRDRRSAASSRRGLFARGCEGSRIRPG